MRTQFKWINVFSVVFGASLLGVVFSIFMLRHNLVFDNTVRQMIKISVLLFLMMILVSAVVSALLYYGLRSNQRRIVQKLQWLILGNYTHNVFQKDISNRLSSLDYLGVIDKQLNSLSQQLKDYSDSLIAFSDKHQPLALKQEETIIAQERDRLARDLHDSVSQQLYAATMIVSGIKYTLSDSTQLEKQLNILENIINESQKEVRALLLHLRPVSLENKTLAQGLRLLMHEIQQKVDCQIVYEIDDCDVAPTVENHLFRIVQELLSNSLRHAKANRIEVYLKKDNDRLKLRVVDNGQGFDVKETVIGHYGLQNVKERVNGIGGQITIVSVKYNGTSVDITI